MARLLSFKPRLIGLMHEVKVFKAQLNRSAGGH